MICLETGRLLDAFVDNEFGPAESADLQAHLASCAACSQHVADRESLGRLVRRLPYYPASNQLRAKILRMSTRPRFNPSLLAWAAVLALAVSLGGAVEAVRFARARHVVETTASVASLGFPLVGGRLDRVSGHPVAALVYQRRLHPINVFIWPAADRTAASDTRTIRGFQVRH